jgi:hypothetical protein
MNALEAIVAAGAMGISGILLLTYFFNPIAGVFVGYLFTELCVHIHTT